ncbi:MAG: hypothetical protein QM487_04455 [Candidatus Marithrix sp.]
MPAWIVLTFGGSVSRHIEILTNPFENDYTNLNISEAGGWNSFKTLSYHFILRCEAFPILKS